jgi:FkbM family methyltransferase
MPMDQKSKRTRQNIDVIKALRNIYKTEMAYEDILETSYRQFIRPGDTVMDVGAHTGTHAAQFLTLVGPTGVVLAFEPLPDVMAKLRQRLADRHPNLRTFEVALSSQPQERAGFVRAEGTLAESGLRQREYNNPNLVSPSHIDVQVDTIDNIARTVGLSALAYIKMDIEGGELDAIAGGRQTIDRFRPVISVEYGGQSFSVYGHTEDSLFETAAGLGYHIFDPFMQDIGSREMWDYAKAQYCWDYFLIPQERVSEAWTWCKLPYTRPCQLGADETIDGSSER